MPDTLVDALVRAALRLGLDVVDPMVISNGINLIVRLSPTPVVARVGTLFGYGSAEHWRDLRSRELEFARYLDESGVGVVRPTGAVDPGPHPVEDNWFTLWEHEDIAARPQPTAAELGDALAALTTALRGYPGRLPALGTWKFGEHVLAELAGMGALDDPNLVVIAHAYDSLSQRLAEYPPHELVASHGDAAAGNLLASARGWLWADFDDASLMPPYYDLACAVARTYLLGANQDVTTELLHRTTATAPSEETARHIWFALSLRMARVALIVAAMARLGYEDRDLAGHCVYGASVFLRKVVDLRNGRIISSHYELG